MKGVIIFDNGGASFDRYTAVFTKRYKSHRGLYLNYIAMSERPTHPQGFGQHGEFQWYRGMYQMMQYLGTRIKFEELPIDCQKVVLRDLAEDNAGKPPALPSGVSSRGAQMGRRDNTNEIDLPQKFFLYALQWVDGDYDEGGAYWGYTRGTHIYRAWAPGVDEPQEMFIRAKSRHEAKIKVINEFPLAKFYR